MDPNDPRCRDQFGRPLNVDAPSFVPNPRAQPFVPYNPQVYAPHPTGVYIPPQGQMGQYGGYPQYPPGGYPGYQQQQQQQPQRHQQPPYHQPRQGGVAHPAHFQPTHPSQQQQHQQQEPVASEQKAREEPSSVAPSVNPMGEESDSQNQQQEPLDSWEDLGDSLPPSSSTSSGDKSDPTTQSTVATVETSKEDVSPPPPRLQVSPKGEPLAEGKATSVAKPIIEEKVASSVTFASAGEKKRKDKSKSSDNSSRLHEGASSKGKESPYPLRDDKENLNIIFIGHVDAGKSTIGGQLMYLTGQVDKRTLEKFEREAKLKNRESWYLSWALDVNQEERDKGKTVEVGRAYFETEKKRFHILDAPGHAGFVPNMIGGAAQADIAILVISARRGEFETGFEKGGQTREHTVLVKTAGAKHLVILINKMDDPTVEWAEERYEECKVKLIPFLKKVGFNPSKDIHIMPVSGFLGTNLKEVDRNACPFYSGPSFLEYLDGLGPLNREDNGPVRLVILDRFKDMGTFVIGKLEGGTLVKGQMLTMMPNKVPVEVLQVCRNEQEIQKGFCGDNLKVKLKGVEEEEISSGFVLCSPESLCRVGKIFDAQIAILESKSIICAGYGAVMHIHTLVEEVQLNALIAVIDRKTGKRIQTRPRFVTQSADKGVIARFEASGIICIEAFKDFPQMARFTIRDEGRTVAIGKILKVIE